VVVGHAARYPQEHKVFSFTSVTVYEMPECLFDRFIGAFIAAAGE